MLKKPLVLWLLYSWLKGALVKDGGQTVCRHIFDIATILCINEHQEASFWGSSRKENTDGLDDEWDDDMDEETYIKCYLMMMTGNMIMIN